MKKLACSIVWLFFIGCNGASAGECREFRVESPRALAYECPNIFGVEDATTIYFWPWFRPRASLSSEETVKALEYLDRVQERIDAARGALVSGDIRYAGMQVYQIEPLVGVFLPNILTER